VNEESTSESGFHVDLGGGRQYNLDEIRALGKPVMPDGGHAWAISVVHSLDDPDQALDNMMLDEKTFVGVSDIHCLLCHVTYEPKIRHYKCSQQLPSAGQTA
jgi:hypothetical protein